MPYKPFDMLSFKRGYKTETLNTMLYLALYGSEIKMNLIQNKLCNEELLADQKPGDFCLW